MFNEAQIFNLKVVMQETGIKADTLRAWERRYGLPEPDRTEGGHRLYSEHDIELIKWLQSRQDEGLSISRAVKLWQGLVDEGKDPLLAVEYVGSQKPATQIEVGDNLVEMREKWVNACGSFNEAGAEQILTQAFALYPVETVVTQVLQKGLAIVGERWYQGDMEVQQEHFASSLALRKISSLIAAAPAPTKKAKIIVACAPEEEHTFSPLVLTLLLRHRGWDVIYLGANVPLERMDKILHQINPNLLVFTAMSLHTAATLKKMTKYIVDKGYPVAFGGKIFTNLEEIREMLDGQFLGNRIDEAVDVIEQILIYGPIERKANSVPKKLTDAYENFNERLPFIESYLAEKLHKFGIKSEHLRLANEHLSKNISASLALGNMEYVRPELDWVGELITNNSISNDELSNYLKLYHGALAEELNGAGASVADWFKQF